MTVTQQSINTYAKFSSAATGLVNVKDQLSDVDLDMATYKLDGFNTIAVLTFHIGYYVRAVLSVLEDQPLNAVINSASISHPGIGSAMEYPWLPRRYRMRKKQPV